ncbi:MAG: TRAP transporter small permease, partial [Alphaproteobacteria bacterium]|nr:TRAP transporter small permease [Alphaproteobacteria bacterium]
HAVKHLQLAPADLQVDILGGHQQQPGVANRRTGGANAHAKINPRLKAIKKTVLSGGAAAALVFLPGLTLTSIFDIATRRFLQLGSTPLQELTWHFFFACVMFGIGYAHLKDRHVRVDILRERLPDRTKRLIERVLLIALLIPLSLVLLWFGARMTWLSYVQDEGSRAALGLSSRWIVKSALPIGAILLFLAACYRLARPAQSDDRDP